MRQDVPQSRARCRAVRPQGEASTSPARQGPLRTASSPQPQDPIRLPRQAFNPSNAGTPWKGPLPGEGVLQSLGKSPYSWGRGRASGPRRATSRSRPAGLMTWHSLLPLPLPPLRPAVPPSPTSPRPAPRSCGPSLPAGMLPGPSPARGLGRWFAGSRREGQLKAGVRRSSRPLFLRVIRARAPGARHHPRPGGPAAPPSPPGHTCYRGAGG